MSIPLTDEALAIRLREVLKLTKTSQRDVCKELGIPYRTLQSYLSGTTKIPAVFVFQLSRYLMVELDFILSDTFRPRMIESIDAIFQALDQVNLLPKLGNPPSSDLAQKRRELAYGVTLIFREKYDTYCRDGLWISKARKFRKE